MGNNSNLIPLRVALVAIGIIFVVGVYPLTILWPSGWAWHTSGPSTYLQMILGIYATLGVFLLVAGRRPLNNFHLVHCLVERRAWRHHGRAGAGLPRASWASIRRRACFVADSPRARGSNASCSKSGSVAGLLTAPNKWPGS